MRLDVRKTLLCSLLALLLAGPFVPGLAAAQVTYSTPLSLVTGTDMTLYEATENMRLLGLHLLNGVPRTGHRVATSELMGVARRGSPLCPNTVPPGTGDCTVNATGSSDVNLATGLGSLTGTVKVVVQDTNQADSPEFVVLKGKFTGKIDFRPTAFGRPCGTVTAHLVVDGAGNFPFTGTFRQPISVGGLAYYVSGSCAFATPGFPTDFVLVNANEFSLSYPTVRFEIIFP